MTGSLAPANEVDRADRRQQARNRIRGPQSALTDFLASHNIDAAQISADYQQRVRDAEQQAAQSSTANDEDKENESDGQEDAAERKKRKRKEEKLLMKIKQSKEFKKRKYENKKKHGSDDEEDDDALAREFMTKKAVPLAGQLENCELCEKRFTVTPYSKTGPDGGLLCPKCSKELKDEEKANQKAVKKKAPSRTRRRQTESDRMMGDVQQGAKSLQDHCVRKVADVVNDIDDFGVMPQHLLDRLSQILSRKRVFTPRTLNLFLREDSNKIDVYDSGKLEEEDFHRIFAHMSHLEEINLRFAGQLKDDALLYMADKCNSLKHLHLGATNLVSDRAWIQLFHQRGEQLESLKLSELNDSMRDDTVKELALHCTNLKRLKLRSCSHMSDESISALSTLTKLQHLTLRVAPETSADTLNNLISSIGPHLRTLCLEGYPEANDSTLDIIRSTCTNLRKLRFTGNNQCTDAAFVDLFTNWSNPPLSEIDFSENRDIEQDAANGDADNANADSIGFGPAAFTAMMAHSGKELGSLDLHSCRHITHAALLDVFDGQKQYPVLRSMDMSFVMMVDEVAMAGIFRSCPNLRKLVVFACFNARAARIPQGIAVIGLPNAQDSIVRGEAVP